MACCRPTEFKDAVQKLFDLGSPGAVSPEQYRDLVAAAISTATTSSVRLKVRVAPHTDA